jgi:hypothetical protein
MILGSHNCPSKKCKKQISKFYINFSIMPPSFELFS